MHMQHLLRPFEAENLIADECPIRPHKHSFYEIVYILEGLGSCVIGKSTYRYSSDDMFIIVPENGHHTVVESTTSFLFIRFNSKFLNTPEQAGFPDRAERALLEKLEFIFLNQQKLKDQLDEHTRIFLRLLCTSILRESSGDFGNGDALVHQLVRTMLMVITKQVDTKTKQISLPEKSSIRVIVDYIHDNIKSPDRLRIECIAAHANMSKNYVNEYFKKYSAKSLQQYITDCKFQLIEERLCRSDLRLSEIAFEFGFSDESHLVSAFKRRKGVSPIRYRRLSRTSSLKASSDLAFCSVK